MTSNKPLLPLSALAAVLTDADLLVSIEGEETQVTGMNVDSREITAANLFVCKGVSFKPCFLTTAKAAGASAYLCDKAHADELATTEPGMPRLVVHDVRRAMALVAPVIYNHANEQLFIAGITGTKGKSTTAYMLRSIMDAAQTPSGIMGSIVTDDGIECFESHNTTPEAPELWRHLANTVDAGRKDMIMEVSSQALKYDRVLGLPIDIACFLNIDRDHISANEHPDFDDYFESKLRIFAQSKMALINLNAAHTDRILEAAQDAPAILCYCIKEGCQPCGTNPTGSFHPKADLWAVNVRSNQGRITFDARWDAAAFNPNTTPEERVKIQDPGYRTPLDKIQKHTFELGIPGLFNVENALAAIGMALLMGAPLEAIHEGLAHLRVPGRMEIVRSADNHVTAIIDYAHNKLSFETLFTSVKKEYPEHRIIALFGAPGDKAIERREQLPQVAGKYADLLIFTEEDPAHERVEDICQALASNTPAGCEYRIITDREEAVIAALKDAADQEQPSVVLLLAKGDETRQHRGDEYPLVKSDLELARTFLA